MIHTQWVGPLVLRSRKETTSPDRTLFTSETKSVTGGEVGAFTLKICVEESEPKHVTVTSFRVLVPTTNLLVSKTTESLTKVPFRYQKCRFGSPAFAIW